MTPKRRKLIVDEQMETYISFESGQGGRHNSPYVVVWVRVKLDFKYHKSDDFPESRPREDALS